MSILVYSILAVLIGGLALFLYRHKGLSLSDKANIGMTIVNIVLLILAVVSIHIAVKSYQSANESGSQQQKTLDAAKDSLLSVVGVLNKQQETLNDSRRALDESASVMTEQKKLLQESVQTSRNQLAVLNAQSKRLLEQTDIEQQQLELNKALSHIGIEPYLDCDFIFPSPNDKSDPYIFIINKSPIKISMVTVDGYAMPFDRSGKGGLSFQRRTYPGHLFFKQEFKPYDFAKAFVMKVPPPHLRPKDIVKIFYVFDLSYRRSTDLAEFKNRVVFELFEDGSTRVQRIINLRTHPYYSEIESWIRSQKGLLSKDTPESFLKY